MATKRLTASEKRIVAAVLKGFRAIIDEMVQVEQMGGYDGATEVKDDDWAEQGKRRKRIGF